MIFKGWSTPLVQLFGANDASTEGERRKLQKASKVFVVLRSGCQEISYRTFVGPRLGQRKIRTLSDLSMPIPLGTVSAKAFPGH